MALMQRQYKTCKDEKPCNVVNFQLMNVENAIYKSDAEHESEANHYQRLQAEGYFPRSEDGFVNVGIHFNDFIVEEIIDSYVDNFITIFSEIGGALGILVGLSCMTVVEFLVYFVSGKNKVATPTEDLRTHW